MHALSNHSSISLSTLGHHIHLLGREKTEQVAQARLLMEKIDRCPKSILFDTKDVKYQKTHCASASTVCHFWYLTSLFDTQSQVKLVYKEIKNGPFF